MPELAPSAGPEAEARPRDAPGATSAEAAVDVEGLVARYGLHRAGARLPIVAYTRQLWQRRHFITAFSTASNAVGYSRSFLGQAWQLLTPLLSVGVYYLVFGVLLSTRRGVHNFIGFLSVGIFVFGFCSVSVMSGARAITGNLALTRALHFPRAVLPISTTLVALQQLLYSMIILGPIVVITGEPLSWRWLELVPGLALQSMFCLGLAFILARIGARVPDTSQLLPFAIRVWLYTSGILYSVKVFAKGHGQWVKDALQINPGAVFVNLDRHALLTHNPVSAFDWGLGIAWGLGMLVVGYVIFWQGEEEYGRV
jgi:teichoic acid transport system permease protein